MPPFRSHFPCPLAPLLRAHEGGGQDILADRIGIIAKGRLRCLGSSVHLKSRFGAGYTLSVAAPDEAARARVKGVFRETLGVEAVAGESGEQHLSFKVPAGKEAQLPRLFERLEQHDPHSPLDAVQLSMSPPALASPPAHPPTPPRPPARLRSLPSPPAPCPCQRGRARV